MQVGNQNDDGLSLILGFGATIEINITPTGIRDVAIRYEKFQNKLVTVKFPLGIPIKFQVEMLASLGIKVETDVAIVEAPLAITRQVLNLIATCPLRKQWKICIKVDRANRTAVECSSITEMGEPKRKTIRSLKELRKLLREE